MSGGPLPTPAAAGPGPAAAAPLAVQPRASSGLLVWAALWTVYIVWGSTYLAWLLQNAPISRVATYAYVNPWWRSCSAG